jgi:hypothetical protein
LTCLAGLLLYLQSGASAATVIDFESFNDGDILTSQIPGLTFTNTNILSAGISLNEFEFPPYSGSNVASDIGGPITINFASPITSFSGYFTYLEPLTITAFDFSDIQVVSAASAFFSNDALYGDPGSNPNEFLQVSFAAGIASVIIEADPNGGSFVMDDLSYTPAVPEPSSLYLALTGVAALLALRKKLL